MKLKDCLDIGIECGMSTVSNCVENVDIHAMSLFVYNKIGEEIAELNSELCSLVECGKIALNDTPQKALKILRELNKED